MGGSYASAARSLPDSFASTAVLSHELEATVDALREERERRAAERAAECAAFGDREAELGAHLQTAEAEATALRRQVDQFRAAEEDRARRLEAAEARVAELEARCLTLDIELGDVRGRLGAKDRELAQASTTLADARREMIHRRLHDEARRAANYEEEARQKADRAAAAAKAAKAPPAAKKKKKKAAPPREGRAAAAKKAQAASARRPSPPPYGAYCRCGCRRCTCATTSQLACKQRSLDGLYALKGYIPQNPAPRLP